MKLTADQPVMHLPRRAFLSTSLFFVASAAGKSTVLPVAEGDADRAISLAPQLSNGVSPATISSRAAGIRQRFPATVQLVRTAGYAAAGDGGGALYRRVTSEPVHEGKFHSRDGAWFELAEEELALEMFATAATLAANATPSLVAAAGVNRPIKGRPGATYTLTSLANLGDVDGLDFDGQGARLRIVGNVQALARYAAPASSRSVRSGGAAGTNSVRVASTSGLAIGQDIQIFAENYPLTEPGAYPYHWARIVSLPGRSVVTFDSALPVTYSGAITLRHWTSTLKRSVRLVNVTLDGADCTYAESGSAFWFAGYRRIDVDVRLEGFTGASPVLVMDCIEADVRVHARGYSLTQAAVINVQQCGVARVTGADLAGSGFGVTLIRCAVAMANENVLRGRLLYEQANGLGSRSVRGIKMTGNGRSMVGRNEVSGYESLIKIQAAHSFEVVDNILSDAGGDRSGIALNISSMVAGGRGGNPLGRSGLVARNSVERCSGAGIGVDNEAALKVTISDNTVRSVGAYGIYANLPDAIIIGNQISDWDLTGRGYVGVHYGTRATVRRNRFRHADPTKPCLRAVFENRPGLSIDGNLAETGNPLFATRPTR